MVGQEHVTDPLSTALDTGRISHAYLFSGPRGCGKTSSARILARSLNCVEGPTSRPCGVCSSCVALAPGGPGNLDVIELDAASHGGVDDTRELRDRAFYAPAESRYRVFIVDEAHMVTTAGFNALLKIVEEPPAHLIFVFATTEPDKVLPTIRSRTHHYPFRLLPPATMRGLLGKICEQEGVQVEEAVYPLVIRAGGGSPRDSLSVLDQLLAGAGSEGVTYQRALALLGVTDIALIDEAVAALAAGDGAALFGTVDRVVEAGHDPRRFGTDLLERMRDLILLRAVPDAVDRNLVTGPADVLDRMRDQAERIGPATLTRYAELLHEGLGEMRGATAPRLLLEVVCARMLLPAVSDAESATLQRLERLERGMASGSLPAAPNPAAGAPARPATPPAAGPETPPAPPSAGGSRRRGAEALAAIRAEKTGPPTHSAADSGTRTPTSGPPPAEPAAPPARQAAEGAATPAARSGDDAAAPAARSAESAVVPAAQSVAGADPSRSQPAPSAAEPNPAEAAVAQAPHSAEGAAAPAVRSAESAVVPATQSVEGAEPSASRPVPSASAPSNPEAGELLSREVDGAASAGAVSPEASSSQTRDVARVAAEQRPHPAQRAQAPHGPEASGAPQAGSTEAEKAAAPTGEEVETAAVQGDSPDVRVSSGRGETAPGDTGPVDAEPSAQHGSEVVETSGAVPHDSSSDAISTGRAGTEAAVAHSDTEVAADGDAGVPAESAVPQDVSHEPERSADDFPAGPAGADADGLPQAAGAPESADRRDVAAAAGSVAHAADAPGPADGPDSSDAAEASEPVAAPGAMAGADAPGGDVVREVEAKWGEIRGKVREFGAAVHALLSGAAVARVEGDTIVFAHQHAPLAQRLSNPKYVEAVQGAVQAVLGRAYAVRWEVGSGAAPAGNSGSAPAGGGRGQSGPGRGAAPARRAGAGQPGAGQTGAGQPGAGQTGAAQRPAQPEAPRYTRPSQSRAASPEATGSASGARGRESGPASAESSTPPPPPDDDIPLPDGPDLPDDPGPGDYSSVGYDGVPPASTPEEEQEMLAESARPAPPGDRRDPDEVALELLASELGATRLEA
ncbi:DNA polymerase III subunit gamma and tau [Nocardia blacklockiae]|uniref:DNA polymerase III subunit gamma and tau n=1 Tax=Nocardia blacklockiae TaxID=480036 RepID=UPI002B4ADCB0|nr:DNA polymerase III subunit gamma and tau [Nocardia blacklockiae]